MMPRRPRALDLFCGAGGAAVGLHRAGFDVFGVDRRPQPRYPFFFKQADAMDEDLAGYDFIWASPPCQAYSVATQVHPGAKERHADLVAPVREKLVGSGALWCMENVPGAPLRPDVVLTGLMFGLRLIRRRHFETNFLVLTGAALDNGRGLVKAGLAETVAGGGNGREVKRRWSEAMGIDWMTRRELAQAIPPAYSEHIGRWAMRAIGERAMAA